MATNGITKLTPPRRRFVQILLTAKSVTAAAIEANIGLRTAHRWSVRPDVKRALAEAQTQSLAATTRRLAAGMTKALDTLETIHTDPEMPPGVRTSAARCWLDGCLKYGELANLSERVTELEGNQWQGLKRE